MRLLVVLALVCSAALLGNPIPGGAAELSAQQSKEARKVYLVKCAKCHELYDPKAYDNAEWDKWMVKMKKKSKLKDDQFELLREYMAMLRTDPSTARK